jgi:predicted acetyltransferase
VALRIREADPRKECEALAEGQRRAFGIGDPKTVAAYYAAGEHIVAGETLVAEEDGVLAAQATAARMTMSIAGAEIACPGVTLVGCMPEHRRRGAVDRLMRGLLGRMKKRREAVSALYPFYAPFYEKFGYARVDWPELFVVPPSQFRPSDARRDVRRLDRTGDLPALMACYDRWRVGRTGPLVRSEYWWRARVFGKVQDGVVFAKKPRKGQKPTIDGYLFFEISGQPNQIAADFTVKELVAVTPEARRGLYGFLNALGEQYRRIHVVFPRGEGPAALSGLGPTTDALACARHQVVGSVLAGAMLRIVDLKKALAAHPGPARSTARGTVGLDLTDPLFADQTASFDLTVDATGAAVKRGRKAAARIALPIGAFSQVYLGAVRAQALLEHGVHEGHPEAAAFLDSAFAGPVPFWSELNGF